MVVIEQCVAESVKSLPQLALDSMSQGELKKLIPVLVTKVTGRKSPLFGSTGYKPEWWPNDLEWTNPEVLADKYQDPCEKLREVIRSCYCYMDQDNLLTSSDLAEYNLELPLSTSEGESDMCAVDPDSHQASQEEDLSEVKKPSEETTEVMTIQNEASQNVAAGDCLDNTYEKIPPSKTIEEQDNKVTGRGDLGVVGDVQDSMEVNDCEITGMSVNTGPGSAENISADVIAQIDHEIAISLKAAFANLSNFGTDSASGQVKKKGVTRNHLGRLHFGSLFGYSKGVSMIKTTGRRRSADADEQKKDNSVSGLETILPPKPKQVSKTININEKLPSDSSRLSKLDNSEASAKDEKPSKKQDKSEDEVVWICFICAKGFADQSELMKHQDVCEEPDLPDLESNQPASTNQSVSTSSLTKDDHMSASSGQPVPAVLRKVGSNLKSLPLGLPNRPSVFRSRVRRPVDVYIPPSREIYFESLGLLPTPSVQAIANSPRKSVTDDDCQIIDLTVDDAQQSVPMTPRTRSMLSQLSREDSHGRRRHLSFSQYLPPPSSVVKEPSEESESSDEDESQRQKIPSKAAILGIPLTSPLGQRLKKHWNYENKVPIIEDIELFCKTDANSLYNLVKKEKKNAMVEKLRNRPPPQCTFKFTKKYVNRWFHLYKFNKADKHEFYKRLKFGLDRESRLKLKRMKPCKVVIAHLTEKDIKYWTTPRPKVTAKRFLPQPTMLSQYSQNTMNQMQLNMAQSYLGRPMPLLHGMLQPVRNMGPTPQLLVRTVPMGGQGMRLQVLPIQNQTTNVFLCSPVRLPAPAPQELSRSQKRKQQFNNIREDDNMVICIDSDEEEEIVIKPLPAKKPASCAMCNIYKDDCKIHGRRKMGPASYMNRHQTKTVSSPISTSILSTSILKSRGTGQSSPDTRSLIAGQSTNSASARVFHDNAPSASKSPLTWSYTDLSNFTSSQISDLKNSVAGSKAVDVSSQTVSRVKVETSSGIQNDVQSVKVKVDAGSSTVTQKLDAGSSTVTQKVDAGSSTVTQKVDAGSSTVTQKVVAGSSTVTQKEASSLDDSEYMDFEVICIDSEDDE